MPLTRREFLERGSRSVTLAAAAMSFPNVLARTAAAATRVDPDGRILVLIQLTGGNDGLNTVIPHRHDLYRQLRPTLAVPRDQVLRLNDDIGLHPRLVGLKRLFDDGLLSIVQGVGYPNPNRSHFESMDIWHCADPSRERLETGWLGRVVERSRDCRALHLDHEPLPLALRAERADVPSVSSIESFRLQGDANTPTRRAISAILSRGASDDAKSRNSSSTLSPSADDTLQFIRRTAVAACDNARRLDAIPAGHSAAYPNFGLATRLREIARLIAADYGPRIFYTSLGGFDTHARQDTMHPNLMAELGESVAAFFADLSDKHLADKVLLMTFSEFGRRAAENASLGTDHGAAAPLFVAGPVVRPGIVGDPPDLANLVDDDVPHTIDFRRVYAAILDRWLRVPSTDVLQGSWEPLDLLQRA